MQNNTLLNKVLLFEEKSKQLIGKKLEVRQAISNNKDNFDRHFTCFSNFEFTLKHTGIRISGAKLFFFGETFGYEIDPALLIEFEEKANNHYCFTEKLSEEVYKRSELTFLD